MAILYRTPPPTYKGHASPPAQTSTGFLSSFWCYLFGGGAAPAYRDVTDERSGAGAPVVSRCWWGLTASPQYQDPPMGDPNPQEPCDGHTGDGCPCGSTFVPDEHVPGEIHIYPNE